MTWPTDCVSPREPLSKHTSFRIGGPAEWFAEPDSIDELIAVLREASKLGLPVSVIGGGTNTLAADRGARGVVVHLARGFKQVQILSQEEEPVARVRVGSAVLMQRIVYLASLHGWGSTEWLAGLPGHIGGAVTMNAQKIGEMVRSVRLVRFDGTVKEIPRSELRFGYRFTAMEPGVIADVVLEFPKVPPAEAYEKNRKALARRNATQELRLPSAGCAFKNPPGGSTGALIDEMGLKGSRVGDAQVSSRHANFIVNLGQATCDDVLSLMEYLQRSVERSCGVTLEPEVRLIGERWLMKERLNTDSQTQA